MNLLWRRFLESKGATVTEEGRLHVGDVIAEASAAQQQDIFTSCLHWSAIRVNGADALTFLGGQLTSDVRELDDVHSQPTAWCNSKGRVLVNGRLVKLGDACAFIVHRELQPSVLKRLRMYVLRAKVTLEDADDIWVLLGCSGPKVAEYLSHHFGHAMPDKTNGSLQIDACAITRLPGTLPRYLLCLPQEAAVSLWSQLESLARPVGTSAWELTDILAGSPMIRTATSETYLPQMLQLERDGGLSFSKGCYPGQEVITRLKYRGELKQQIYCGELQSNQVPALNSPVLLADSGMERKVGEVIEAAPLAADRVAVSAVLEIAVVNNDKADKRFHINGTELVVAVP